MELLETRESIIKRMICERNKKQYADLKRRNEQSRRKWNETYEQMSEAERNSLIMEDGPISVNYRYLKRILDGLGGEK